MTWGFWCQCIKTEQTFDFQQAGSNSFHHPPLLLRGHSKRRYELVALFGIKVPQFPGLFTTFPSVLSTRMAKRHHQQGVLQVTSTVISANRWKLFCLSQDGGRTDEIFSSFSMIRLLDFYAVLKTASLDFFPTPTACYRTILTHCYMGSFNTMSLIMFKLLCR
jgi:hypothetical protein